MFLLTFSFWFSILGMIIFPIFGRLALHGSGNEADLFRYLVPMLVGGFSGYLVGLQTDRLDISKNLLERERKAHHTSAKRSESLFEMNHSATLIIAPDTAQILEANPAAAHFYGYGVDKLTKMKMTQIDTTDSKKVLEKYRQLKKGKPRKLNSKHRLSNGEVRHVKVHWGPILLEEQNVLIAVITDLTELRLLNGLLPICSACGIVRKDRKYLHEVEQYIKAKPTEEVKHTHCPACEQLSSQDSSKDNTFA